MKRLCCIIIVVGLNCGVFGFEYLGPSVSTYDGPAASVSFEYSTSKMDIEAEGIPELGIGSFIVKDAKLNKYHAKITGGVTKDLELFFKSGTGTLEGPSGDESNHGLLLGGGLKIALARSELFDWGIIAQTGWGSFSYDEEVFEIEGVPVTIEEKVSFHEVQIATGPTFHLGENVLLYGGPFMHFITGKDSIEGTVDGLDADTEIELNEDDVLGGFIGGMLRLSPQLDMAVEYQATGSGEGIAASLKYRF